MADIHIRDNFTPNGPAHIYGKYTRRPRLTPTPTKERIDITPEDLLYTDPLRVHGPLTLPFIVRLIDTKRGMERHKQRAKQLFHEDNTYIDGKYWGFRFLSRPYVQKYLINPHTDDLIYGLTDATRKLLDRRGIPHSIQRSHFNHQHKSALGTASIAIEAKGHFEDRFQVFGDRPLSFDVDGEALEPDDLFRLRHEEGIIHFWEQDNGTETLISDSERQTIERKFRKYIPFIGKRWYKTALDTGDQARLLFVTNSKARMENIMALLNEMLDRKGSKHILFNYVPHFGKRFKQPPVLSYLYTAPWERVGHPPSFINQ